MPNLPRKPATRPLVARHLVFAEEEFAGCWLGSGRRRVLMISANLEVRVSTHAPRYGLDVAVISFSSVDTRAVGSDESVRGRGGNGWDAEQRRGIRVGSRVREGDLLEDNTGGGVCDTPGRKTRRYVPLWARVRPAASILSKIFCLELACFIMLAYVPQER